MMSLTGHIIGLDEVGRGALAGPVVVGLVSLAGQNPQKVKKDLEKVLGRKLADSKKLTALQREKAALFIQKETVWQIGQATANEVDTDGIVGAVRSAAGRAMDEFQKTAQSIKGVLADAGLHHPYEKIIPTEHFVKGDERIIEITLASIIAKVYRDKLMQALIQQFPSYGWEQNVGYGTSAHFLAIQKVGITEQHRKSFLK